MKKYSLLSLVTLLTASVAGATDHGAAEAFLGYNLVNFNPSITALPSFTIQGGNAQFAYNFSPWVGAVLDFGAVNATENFRSANNFTPNRGIDHSLMNVVIGPRFTYHNHSRFVPFVQTLFGGARAKSSTSITLNQGATVWPPVGLPVAPGLAQPIEAELEADRTGFAMILGGGLDIKISKHIAFRPIGADYYMTRLPGFVTGNDTNKNHFRYTAGVNFMFGGAR